MSSRRASALLAAAAATLLIAAPAAAAPIATRAAPDQGSSGQVIRDPVTARLAKRSAVAAAVGPLAVCSGDGVSGNRVQLVYVRGDASADRYDQLIASFRQMADQIDAGFSGASGGTRHVRYVHDAACTPVVNRETVPQSLVGNAGGAADWLRDNRGYNRSDRKYVMWQDWAGCGVAWGNGGDDRADASNPYNAGPHYAAVGTSCMTWQATAHELLHTLGAVQRSAPHSTLYGHCWDDQDIMCYNDGGVPNPPGGMVNVCGGDENQFDCNHDDYFNVSPPAGSYLATHWNVARSVYLTGGGTTPGGGAITGIGGQCVDVYGHATGNGSTVGLWSCSGGANQRWTVNASGTIVGAESGRCLDVNGAGTADGTRVQVWDCNGSSAQVWQRNAGRLFNPNSGKCLDASGGSSANGTLLIIWTCHNNVNQQWTTP